MSAYFNIVHVDLEIPLNSAEYCEETKQTVDEASFKVTVQKKRYTSLNTLTFHDTKCQMVQDVTMGTG